MPQIPTAQETRTRVTPSQPAPKSRPARGGRSSSTKDAEMEAAIDRMEEAQTLTQISNNRGNKLQMKLTEQMAVTAERDAKLADMEAQLTAAKKTIVDAETRRESSDGDGGIAVGDGSGEILPTGLKANLTIHVHAIFKNIKFINDATLKAIPQIM